MTLGDSNAVDHLILLKDGVDLDGLLEQTVAEADLVCDGTTVDLNLHQMGLLLLEGGLADLCVGENADDCAVLLDALDFAGDRVGLALGVCLGILCECLLLRAVPVLVEAALQFI